MTTAGAVAMFLSSVSGLDWAECQALLEERIPGAVAQTIADADTFFGVAQLPALTQWTFGADQAAALDRPVLSILGAGPSRCGLRSPSSCARRSRM